ncbi:hypothetical protein [Diatraea saccharalis granulovirus]|uniref:Uncharacterized protein n=1 Tax=Diatraea saccharalis granulovirus TaxID=1675862 RepID=A0A0R7EYV4_9BBAC|nr:hypothetical protein [Diatraea saccharalis granulovirus]AKN80773.1 hypothetical protein [Diatraea saccharalis granulovirus]
MIIKMFFALDGVACTTKTTILKKLHKDNISQFRVHRVDFKEISDKLKLGADPALDSMLFIAYRSTYQVNKNYKNVFDREPVAGLLYRLIFLNSDEKTIEKYCTYIKMMKINRGWKSIILLPIDGQEDIVVNMMLLRNNGIDWLDPEYVRRQTKVYKIWARVMNYDVVYIDFTKNITEQQDFIITKLINLCLE